MQKKLVLAAVAGVLVAPVVFAEATIYGHLDIGVQHVDPGGDYNGADWFVTDQQGSGGSLLGFRASDDIGGGLRGLAVVEFGFLSDTGNFDNTVTTTTPGTLRFAQRQVYAGVAGRFGTLTAGRQYREAFIAGNTAAYNYTASGIGVAFLNQYTAVRQDNFIKYVSPGFGGANLVVGYAPGEGTDAAGLNQDDGKYTEFGLRWSAGTLRLGAVVATSTSDPAASPAIDLDVVVLGGQYSLGPTTLYALYTTGETDDTPKTLDASSMSFGVKYTIGDGDVVLQGGQSQNDNAVDADATLIGLAYYHRLSKVTTVYVSYADVDNEANGRQVAPRQLAGTDASSGLLLTGTAGVDPSTLSFGIRRFF